MVGLGVDIFFGGGGFRGKISFLYLFFGKLVGYLTKTDVPFQPIFKISSLKDLSSHRLHRSNKIALNIFF